MSVWHVRTLCSNSRRYRPHFFCVEQSHVSPRSCKNLAYVGKLTKLLFKFCPKVTHPWWFERRTHSIANYGRTVRGNAMVTNYNGHWTAYTGNHRRMVWAYHRWPHKISISPKWRLQMHLTSDVAFCQITFALGATHNKCKNIVYCTS